MTFRANCETCAFFHETYRHDGSYTLTGECRRHAPRGGERPATHVDGRYWCGEHHPQAGADQIKGDQSSCGGSSQQRSSSDASSGSEPSSTSTATSAHSGNPVATSLRAAVDRLASHIRIVAVPLEDDGATRAHLMPAVQSAALAAASEIERLARERGAIDRKLSDVVMPLHEFVQGCGLFDGTDAGYPVAETAVKYARVFQADRDAWKKRAEQAEREGEMVNGENINRADHYRDEAKRLRRDLAEAVSILRNLLAVFYEKAVFEYWHIEQFLARLDKRAAHQDNGPEAVTSGETSKP